MCTLAFYFQDVPKRPLVIAANRDESFFRPSAAPEVLRKTFLILAGKDLFAGGTWLGVNEYGLVAGILNRRSKIKKDPAAVRSRGQLCLDVLSTKGPDQACSLLAKEDGAAYQPFNLLIANPDEAYVSYNVDERIFCSKLEKGLHVLSNASIYESPQKKREHAHALFSKAQEKFMPRQEMSFWISALKQALSDHTLEKDFSDPTDAICVHTESYGTVSSSIIVYDASDKSFHSYYAPGPPCRQDYGTPLCLKVHERALSS